LAAEHVLLVLVQRLSDGKITLPLLLVELDLALGSGAVDQLLGEVGGCIVDPGRFLGRRLVDLVRLQEARDALVLGLALRIDRRLLLVGAVLGSGRKIGERLGVSIIETREEVGVAGL
jgi:hypothetical protein